MTRISRMAALMLTIIAGIFSLMLSGCSFDTEVKHPDPSTAETITDDSENTLDVGTMQSVTEEIFNNAGIELDDTDTSSSESNESDTALAIQDNSVDIEFQLPNENWVMWEMNDYSTPINVPVPKASNIDNVINPSDVDAEYHGYPVYLTSTSEYSDYEGIISGEVEFDRDLLKFGIDTVLTEGFHTAENKPAEMFSSSFCANDITLEYMSDTPDFNDAEFIEDELEDLSKIISREVPMGETKTYTVGSNYLAMYGDSLTEKTSYKSFDACAVIEVYTENNVGLRVTVSNLSNVNPGDLEEAATEYVKALIKEIYDVYSLSDVFDSALNGTEYIA